MILADVNVLIMPGFPGSNGGRLRPDRAVPAFSRVEKNGILWSGPWAHEAHIEYDWIHRLVDDLTLP